MEKLFRYEKDLVDTFITNYFDKKNKISLRELPIRWGNIDIAFIYLLWWFRTILTIAPFIKIYFQSEIRLFFIILKHFY